MTTKRAQLGIIFLTILIDMIGFGIVIPVLPIYAETFHATPLQNGLLVAIFRSRNFSPRRSGANSPTALVASRSSSSAFSARPRDFF